MKTLFVGLLALMLASCTTTPDSKEQFARLCALGEAGYAAFQVKAEEGNTSPKTVALVETAYVVLHETCTAKDPDYVTALVIAASAYYRMTQATKKAGGV